MDDIVRRIRQHLLYANAASLRGAMVYRVHPALANNDPHIKCPDCGGDLNDGEFCVETGEKHAVSSKLEDNIGNNISCQKPTCRDCGEMLDASPFCTVTGTRHERYNDLFPASSQMIHHGGRDGVTQEK